jgi:hypothetical protein
MEAPAIELSLSEFDTVTLWRLVACIVWPLVSDV